MQHELYMSRCIALSKRGLRAAMPNPCVGAVVVFNDMIIGEGWTSPYGGPHAEVNAINSVKNKNLLEKSTLYVSLEPCSHHGKTPPCVSLIEETKIPKIIIGCQDPYSEVAGRGIQKLKNIGREVIVRVLEEECLWSHRRFITLHQHRRPYIILKWAQSADNFIAPNQSERMTNSPFWISNIESRQLVHKWRSEETAILIGSQTAIDDNPSLNTRMWYGRNPLRIVFDNQQRISKQATIFNDGLETYVFTTDKNYLSTETTKVILVNSEENYLRQVMETLVELQITSLIVEGGAKTLQNFIDQNLWDEARVFKGSIKFNRGINAPKLNGNVLSESRIKDTQLTIYTRK